MNNQPKPTLNLPKGVDPTAWLSEVLGTAGTIGGAILGGPIGAGIGGFAGSALGSALEQQLRDNTIDQEKLLKEAIMSGVTGALFTGGAKAAGVGKSQAGKRTFVAPGYQAPNTKYVGSKFAPSKTTYAGGKFQPTLNTYQGGKFQPTLTTYQGGKFQPTQTVYQGGKYMPPNTTYVGGKYVPDAPKQFVGGKFRPTEVRDEVLDRYIKLNQKGFIAGDGAKKATKVYYHGTPNPEAIKSGFDLSKAGTTSGSKGVYGKGIYLTNEIDRAKLYGTPVQVPLGKAKIKTIDSSKSLTELFARDTNYGDPDMVAKKYLDQGFDGIRVINKATGSEELAIFNPSVLKISSKLKPKNLLNKSWYRGVDKLNVDQADKFYSASKEVAGDYGKVLKLKSKNLPKNPLVVTDKDELASIINYKGDPFIQPKGIAKSDLFDTQAKKYAQSKGFDSILYKSGSFESPELHVFSGVKAAPKKTTNIYYHGTTSGNTFSKFDLTKANTGVGSNAFNQGDLVYLTKDRPAAEIFSRFANEKKFLREGVKNIKDLGKASQQPTGEVLEFSLSPTAKIAKLNKAPTAKDISLLKSQGFDGVEFSDEKAWTKFTEGRSFKMPKDVGTTAVWNVNALTPAAQTSASVPVTPKEPILRGTTKLTEKDILETLPNIKLKQPIQATTLSGAKETIKKGEALTPYVVKGNNVLLQDGKAYLVSRNQFTNIKNNSISAEAVPFLDPSSYKIEKQGFVMFPKDLIAQAKKEGFVVKRNPVSGDELFLSPKMPSRSNKETINIFYQKTPIRPKMRQPIEGGLSMQEIEVDKKNLMRATGMSSELYDKLKDFEDTKRVFSMFDTKTLPFESQMLKSRQNVKGITGYTQTYLRTAKSNTDLSLLELENMGLKIDPVARKMILDANKGVVPKEGLIGKIADDLADEKISYEDAMSRIKTIATHNAYKPSGKPSTHFGEGLLGHTRGYTDVINGKKAFISDEIQSDWRSKLAKQQQEITKQFGSDVPSKAEILKELDDYSTARAQISINGAKIRKEEAIINKWKNDYKAGKVDLGTYPQALDDYIDDLRVENQNIASKFTNTGYTFDITDRLNSSRFRDRTVGYLTDPSLKTWREDLVKANLKEAVDRDAKMYAWTTGKQQMRRWSAGGMDIQGITVEDMWERGLSETPGNMELAIRLKQSKYARPFIDAQGPYATIEFDKNTGDIISSHNTGIGQQFDNITQIFSKPVLKQIDRLANSQKIGSWIEFSPKNLQKYGIQPEDTTLGMQWYHELYDNLKKQSVENITGQKVKYATGYAEERIPYIDITSKIKNMVAGKAPIIKTSGQKFIDLPPPPAGINPTLKGR